MPKINKKEIKKKEIKQKEEVSLLWADDGTGKNQASKKKKGPGDIDFDPAQTILRIRPEKKGRGGKVVTVIYELPENQAFFKKLTKELKTRCGCGGSFKQQSIEIQGQRVQDVKSFLEEKGFKVIVSGGSS